MTKMSYFPGGSPPDPPGEVLGISPWGGGGGGRSPILQCGSAGVGQGRRCEAETLEESYALGIYRQSHRRL